jgi:hypothetical protein
VNSSVHFVASSQPQRYSHLAKISEKRGIRIREFTPQLAADQITSDEIGKMFFSRAKYRHNAILSIFGKKEIIPDKLRTQSEIEHMFLKPVHKQIDNSVGFK